MDSFGILTRTRSLLQSNLTSTTKHEGCSGGYCVLFDVLIITSILAAAGIIFATILYQKWKLSKALREGNVSAHMVISYWTIRPSERGDLDAFTFPIHVPVRREDINEQSCPICLRGKPKPASWVIFDACNHATCNSCFKKIVAQHRLHAACPICRTLLAKGKGDRGCPRQQTPNTEESSQADAVEGPSSSQPAGDTQV